MQYYVTQKQVDDCGKHYYEKYHKKLSFSEIIQLLYTQGEIIIDTKPRYDHILDFSSEESLYKSFGNHYIDVTRVFENIVEDTTYRTEEFFPFGKHDVYLSFHLTYLEKVLHANHYFVTAYVLKGSAVLHKENETTKLEYGDFLIIPPHTPFNLSADPESIVINICIKNSTFESTFFHLLQENHILSYFFQMSLSQFKNQTLIFKLQPTKDIYALLGRIYEENCSDRIYSRTICNNYTEILFSELFRHYNGEFYTSSQTRHSIYNTMPAILSYIKGNFRHITLTSLADFFNYESNYLGKYIKQYTRMSFNEIISQYKLKEASNLLSYSTYTIEEISQKIGYNSADHFSRAFKKYYHCSPSQYRKNPQT